MGILWMNRDYELGTLSSSETEVIDFALMRLINDLRAISHRATNFEIKYLKTAEHLRQVIQNL